MTLPGAGPRVLIIDEALPVRAKIAEILGKLGVAREEMIAADSPEGALSLFAKGAPRPPPRLVFAEFIGVHPEEGLDIIHEMLERAPGTRVILVTSEPREGPEVRAAMRAGAFAYIEKPVRHDKIRQVLQDLEAEEGGIERMR